YSPENRTVQVKLAERTVKGERMLTVEVKDNGIGIAAEALPRIFDRFYRQDRSRTRQSGGHGLGLAIAHNIVNAGRGTIHAESVVGKGATFTVRLPL
uniref:sensor histidine kinase n=1 Tax=Cohnella sp. TaxID=1883426 RepID=UPI003703AB28